MEFNDAFGVSPLLNRLYKLSDDMEVFIELTNIISDIETDEMVTLQHVHDSLVDLAIRVLRKISRTSIQSPKQAEMTFSVYASRAENEAHAIAR
ncbi:hypothetical protein [Alicyclobacillus sendaiensis]|uniref:hypothetical protein n=1 Tax=Alicyclobacillus sendaiensis TaxID=192387 RepID=UPI0026F410B7|nr:hypothetical protein [Alicyclobacillus sendaiensis]